VVRQWPVVVVDCNDKNYMTTQFNSSAGLYRNQGRLSLSTVGDKCAKDNLGDLLKVPQISVYKNPYNNCCQMRFSLSEYTKIDLGWGFVPDPTGGAYSAPPDPLAGFKWAVLRQEGNGGEGRE